MTSLPICLGPLPGLYLRLSSSHKRPAYTSPQQAHAVIVISVRFAEQLWFTFPLLQLRCPPSSTEGAQRQKMVYSTTLQTKLEDPRQLTISQREQIPSEGMSDREESDRAAANKVLKGWFDLMHAETNSEGGMMGAADALLSLFTTRRGILAELPFDGKQSLLHLREIFNEQIAFAFQTHSGMNSRRSLPFPLFDHYFATHSESRLEAASLLVATVFAFHLQDQIPLAAPILLADRLRIPLLINEPSETTMSKRDDITDPQQDDHRDHSKSKLARTEK